MNIVLDTNVIYSILNGYRDAGPWGWQEANFLLLLNQVGSLRILLSAPIISEYETTCERKEIDAVILRNFLDDYLLGFCRESGRLIELSPEKKFIGAVESGKIESKLRKEAARRNISFEEAEDLLREQLLHKDNKFVDCAASYPAPTVIVSDDKDFRQLAQKEWFCYYERERVFLARRETLGVSCMTREAFVKELRQHIEG